MHSSEEVYCYMQDRNIFFDENKWMRNHCKDKGNVLFIFLYNAEIYFTIAIWEDTMKSWDVFIYIYTENIINSK